MPYGTKRGRTEYETAKEDHTGTTTTKTQKTVPTVRRLIARRPPPISVPKKKYEGYPLRLIPKYHQKPKQQDDGTRWWEFVEGLPPYRWYQGGYTPLGTPPYPVVGEGEKEWPETPDTPKEDSAKGPQWINGPDYHLDLGEEKDPSPDHSPFKGEGLLKAIRESVAGLPVFVRDKETLLIKLQGNSVESSEVSISSNSEKANNSYASDSSEFSYGSWQKKSDDESD